MISEDMPRSHSNNVNPSAPLCTDCKRFRKCEDRIIQSVNTDGGPTEFEGVSDGETDLLLSPFLCCQAWPALCQTLLPGPSAIDRDSSAL